MTAVDRDSTDVVWGTTGWATDRLAAAVQIRTRQSLDGKPRGQPLSDFSLYVCG